MNRDPGLGWMLLATFLMLPLTIIIMMVLQHLGLLR